MKRPGRTQKVRNEPFGDNEIGDHDMPSFAPKIGEPVADRSKCRTKIVRPLDPLPPLDSATATGPHGRQVSRS